MTLDVVGTVAQLADCRCVLAGHQMDEDMSAADLETSQGMMQMVADTNTRPTQPPSIQIVQAWAANSGSESD